LTFENPTLYFHNTEKPTSGRDVGFSTFENPTSYFDNTEKPTPGRDVGFSTFENPTSYFDNTEKPTPRRNVGFSILVFQYWFFALLENTSSFLNFILQGVAQVHARP
jgi:hypothetical protein